MLRGTLANPCLILNYFTLISVPPMMGSTTPTICRKHITVGRLLETLRVKSDSIQRVMVPNGMRTHMIPPWPARVLLGECRLKLLLTSSPMNAIDSLICNLGSWF